MSSTLTPLSLGYCLAPLAMPVLTSATLTSFWQSGAKRLITSWPFLVPARAPRIVVKYCLAKSFAWAVEMAPLELPLGVAVALPRVGVAVPPLRGVGVGDPARGVGVGVDSGLATDWRSSQVAAKSLPSTRVSSMSSALPGESLSSNSTETRNSWAFCHLPSTWMRESEDEGTLTV